MDSLLEAGKDLEKSINLQHYQKSSFLTSPEEQCFSMDATSEYYLPTCSTRFMHRQHTVTESYLTPSDLIVWTMQKYTRYPAPHYHHQTTPATLVSLVTYLGGRKMSHAGVCSFCPQLMAEGDLWGRRQSYVSNIQTLLGDTDNNLKVCSLMVMMKSKYINNL